MYKQTCVVKIENVPKNEPVDLYILKRGADLFAAVATSNTYQTSRIAVESGIRDVIDFTKMCANHEFDLIKDSEIPKQYNLEFTFDMRDSLCTVDDIPCRPATLPDQLLDCLAGN